MTLPFPYGRSSGLPVTYADEVSARASVRPTGSGRRVSIVSLGCARNDVDSEEIAGRLADDGWQLVDDAESADVTVVNTCGFIESAKKDSIDTVLEIADRRPKGAAVVAVGCMAERYGTELAEALPEADAVLGFDEYARLSQRLEEILGGTVPPVHAPRDRRTLLPISPVARRSVVPPQARPSLTEGPVPASGPRVFRHRLSDAPYAPLKLASGCDRRCSFCAIPAFRGSYLSREPDEVLAEAEMLAATGARELLLVSENSTSYGKDLGDLQALEKLLPRLARVEGVEWIRLSYLQPAEMRPSLIEALTGTPKVMPYFDLSFQHSSAPVLRRMRRFGDTDRFLTLLADVRRRAPSAGVRSNFIVGFPGETEADVAELERFLVSARLDVAGVFGYSDEDGTEAAGLDGKLPEDEINSRAAHLSSLVEELTSQRAEERIGERVEVLIESFADGGAEGRSMHQGPETDGATSVRTPVAAQVGALVRATVTGSSGADLVAEVES